jgi:hypothetical protein
MLPFGDASGRANDTLARRYAWQIPLVIDVGGRFARSFFLGAYLGFGVGTTGSDLRVDAACTDDDDNGENDIVCSAASARIGLEMQYAFAPDQRYNPWVGYGIGFEVASASITDHYRALEETDTSTGVTFAQLSVGLDIRQKIGIGPFLEVALGQFNHTTTDLGERGSFKSTIEDRALHAWVMLGGRMVINP